MSECVRGRISQWISGVRNGLRGGENRVGNVESEVMETEEDGQ